ncbi:MAG: NUDIX domain-containing protein [Candidatus Saccharibacteria bacterium]
MKSSYFDVFDEHENSMDLTASYDDVHRQGLWHRGVHVLIYTPDREIVMQKRSASLAYHPNEVEISVGGGVDAGESPQHAALREVHEELGVTIPPEALKYIGKTKYNHRTRSQINRTFIYSYAVCLPKSELQLIINTEETSLGFFISEKKLRRALHLHRIKNVGKISSTYAYWRYLLDAISETDRA